jgi:23S rRNA (uracil1939-C5)-methyltransferase
LPSAAIVVRLDAMAHGGFAVGRYQGKAVFVPYTIPGETARVEIVEDKPRFAKARLLEVITPSPDRIAPRCPYFGDCGGCQWQHISYAAQLRYKQQVVLDQLQRLGKFREPRVLPVIGMDDPWGYRNNARLVPGRDRKLGFQRADSNAVVGVERCATLHPLLQDLLSQIEVDFEELTALSLRCGVNTGERMVILESRFDEAPAIEIDLPVSCALTLSDGEAVTLAGAAHLHERVGERTFRISPTSFFQVNTWGAERLLEVVARALQPRRGDLLLDGYCGVGLFALNLATRVGRVGGIESATSSIEDARANAAGLDNVEFVEGRVEDALAEGAPAFSLAVVDPPRTGMDPAAVDALLSSPVRRLAVVSCDPATLARDLSGLVHGGFRLVEVQPVDMFPQTYHVECVAMLERTQAAGGAGTGSRQRRGASRGS